MISIDNQVSGLFRVLRERLSDDISVVLVKDKGTALQSVIDGRKLRKRPKFVLAIRDKVVHISGAPSPYKALYTNILPREFNRLLAESGLNTKVLYEKKLMTDTHTALVRFTGDESFLTGATKDE